MVRGLRSGFHVITHVSGATAFGCREHLVIERGRFAPNKYSLILPTGQFTGCKNLTGRVERRPHGPMFLLPNAILRKGRIYILTERTVPKGNGMDHP